MKRFLVIVLSLTFQIISSQDIKMEIRIIDEKKEEFQGESFTEYTLQIKLVNESKIDYAVPIDIEGYRIYMLGTQYKDSDFFSVYFYLRFVPKIRDYNDSFLEGGPRLMGRIDDKDLPRLIREANKNKKQYQRTIIKWKKTYNLKGNNNFVDKNKYIYSNIKFIKSGETVTYIKKFAPANMNYSLLNDTYDYYIIKNNIFYPMFLEICIDEKIYDYLTPKQKENFKGYKFFSGKIQSNEVMIRK